MTASSIFRSRRDSSCEAISANLGTTSNHCQVAGETVEAQPPQRCEHEPVFVSDGAPALSDPTTSTDKFRTRQTQAVRRPQPKIYLLGGATLIVQFFETPGWIGRAS